MSSVALSFTVQSDGQMPAVCQGTVSSSCLFEEVFLALDKLAGYFCFFLAHGEARRSIMIGFLASSQI